MTDDQVDPDETVALMGTAEAPPLPMSEVWSEFYKLTAARRLGKSRDHIRKWENPFKRAFNCWIAVNGEPNVRTPTWPSKLGPFVEKPLGWLLTEPRKSRKDRRSAKQEQ
ncbi:MAG: hypothetical protein RQ750_03990 [Roseovarius sp.]|nr:hypothetical protein [Roseovarius sp.]